MNIVFFGVFDAILKITALAVIGFCFASLLWALWWCSKGMMDNDI